MLELDDSIAKGTLRERLEIVISIAIGLICIGDGVRSSVGDYRSMV